MTPEGRMYQATARANVLSPEMFNIIKDEAFHYARSQHYLDRKRQGIDSFIGVLGSGMIQDGSYVNLGEPLSSLLERYAGTSQKGRGLAEGLMVVGLTDSTLSMGKPYTRGSGQQRRGSFRTCHADTLKSGER